MNNVSQDRTMILELLKAELVGPAPAGKEIDCSQRIVFSEAAESYGPWRQQGSGEEILARDTPCKRYGVGVLYPIGITPDDELHGPGFESASPDSVPGDTSSFDALTEGARKNVEEIAKRSGDDRGQPESDDFDLSTANSFRPSSMGVSFLADIPSQATLVVEATGGRYQKRAIKIQSRENVGGKEYIWWLRSPISLRAVFDAADLCSPREAQILPRPLEAANLDHINLSVELFSRPYGSTGRRLITVYLVNRTKSHSQSDQYCVFQAHFKVTLIAPDGSGHVLPYPDYTSVMSSRGERSLELDDFEEQSLALLYRDAQTFAVGHGCAANWGSQLSAHAESLDTTSGLDADSVISQHAMHWISAECLPFVETPSITPEIARDDKSPIEVPMAPLAGLVPGNDGFDALAEVVASYETWISRRESDVSSLDDRYHAAARTHLEACSRSAARMREGMEYLKRNPVAYRAFQLANYAILLQQIHSGRDPRRPVFDSRAGKLTFREPYEEPDPHAPLQGRGYWRPFQIAFLLMAVGSTGEGQALDRETVELIWFPTGGGKTEAYLGLTAFALFMRRLRNQDDAGVHVLMRYTLRLLTAQQFQRAAGLLCAMEHLRRTNPSELGEHEFSIGIWLGGSTTPNERATAIDLLRRLEKGDSSAENLFLLTRCPWCRAQLGPIKLQGRMPAYVPRVPGYERQGSTVVFKCYDARCEFRSGLPVYVIDEDIYEKRPSLVIGTVDKFAMLAWNPLARSLFGLSLSGQRVASPPGLIIQDELHLIAGPLGSMVGLYETLIHELCTDHRGGRAIPPKIVSSTATIRRYEDQIKALYARDQVALFPPPGLDAGDSFFAQYARDEYGRLRHGRIYVGVHAPGLGSVQTAQVRTFAALLQAPLSLPEDQRDPWWTLMLFFNSLRELGTTLSLFQSDIPDYLRVLRNRTGVDFKDLRHLRGILELTGRLRNEEVPAAITDLEARYASSDVQAVDVCLASNIIEVGIDIDRLSLMSIVGQPKTTSQYIQVSGRVGRLWKERPGIVVTIYGAAKPRDRSHFEKFRSYHERLYAQVEPTSLTPFSPPVLDRALHAVMVAYARQSGEQAVAQSPYPYPGDLIEACRAILAERVKKVDSAESKNFERVFTMRARQWKEWERNKWTATPVDQDIPLLRWPGSYVSGIRSSLSWATPTSMRDVDAECEATITGLYAIERANEDEE